MTIEKLCYHQLPEDVKEDMPNNGWGKEDARYIHIEWDNGTHVYHSDAMEPEDATFSRDLSWIVPLLKKVADLSFEAGEDYANARNRERV